MLLDIGSVLGGIGLAVVAFVVVILVCVVILRLLAAILPSYEERDAARLAATAEPVAEDEHPRETEAPVPGSRGADPDATAADPGPES
jgi:Na+-transporting methylmalonyl-CoA/oxaloacetate decarboxylase gamma subunit